MAIDKRLQKEQGASGTTIYSGQILNEEFNPKLQKHQALKVYDEMRRSDATVNAALTAIKLPLIQAPFSVDPASEDEADKEVAHVVQENLTEIIDWRKFLEEALTYQDFGFSLFEMVIEPKDIDGKPYVVVSKLAFRKQTTIYAWEQAKGEPGITQHTRDGRVLSIPLEKLVRFTNRQEGDNYEGISVLRSAYKHWYIKDTLYRIDAMGHERQGLGVLDITHPTGAKQSDLDKMAKTARALRANAQSYMLHEKGWEVQFLDMKAKSMKDIEPSINHHDRQIMKNVLAQFLEIGASKGGGSRATSEDHSRLFEMSVQAIAEYIVQVLQNTVVKTIVDLNFTNRPYPKLSVGRISDDNIPEISAAVQAFVTAGALHPRPADENKVRQMIGLGAVEEDELQTLFDTPAAPTTDPNAPKASTFISTVKQLRASVEEALYADTQRAA